MNRPLIDLLAFNLSQMETALRESANLSHPVPLIPCGKMVFDTTTWLGRIVRIIRFFVHLFRHITPEQELGHLKANLVYTINELFDQRVRQTHQAYRDYVSHLTRLIVGRSVSSSTKKLEKELTDREIRNIRQCVTTCSRVAESFWQMFSGVKTSFQMEQEEKIVEYMREIVGKDSILFDKAFYQLFRRAQSLVNLEGVLNKPIPIAALANCSLSLEPEKNKGPEFHEIKEWMTQLNQCKNKFSLSELEEVLKEIVFIINQVKKEPMELKQLEKKLHQLNCEIFEQSDSDYLFERNGLKEGSKITYQGETLTLGKQLSPHKFIDHRVVFAIQEHPEWVVKFGENRVKLSMEQSRIDWESKHQLEAFNFISFKQPHVKMIGIDQEGGFAILERLELPLSQYQWQSTYGGNLIKAEEEIVNQMGRWLNELCTKNVTCQQLNLDQWMLDSKGKIKSIACLQLSTGSGINYNELEQFCIQFSQGNPVIRKALIEASGLSTHCIATYYRERVCKALEENSVHHLTLITPQGINKNYVTKLCEQALELRDKCCNGITSYLQREGYHDIVRDQEGLSGKIQMYFKEVYHKSSTPGCLDIQGHSDAAIKYKMNELEEEVLRLILEEEAKKKKPGFLVESLSGLPNKIRLDQLKSVMNSFLSFKPGE